MHSICNRAICCVMPALCVVPVINAEAPELATIIDSQAAWERSLGPYVLTESLRRRVSPGAFDEQKATLEELRASALSEACNELGPRGVTKEATASREAQINRHFDESLRGRDYDRANADVSVARRRTVDFSGERIRWDDEDSRDLVALGKRVPDSDWVRLNLDQTRTWIFAKNQYILLLPRADKVASTDPNGMQNLNHERIRIGLLPGWIRSSQVKVDISEGRVAGTLDLKGTSAGGVFTATLDATPPYRVRELRTESPQDDSALRWSLSGGFPVQVGASIPERYEYRVRQRGVDDFVIEEATTSEFRAQAAVNDDLFKIPMDYRVSPTPL